MPPEAPSRPTEHGRSGTANRGGMAPRDSAVDGVPSEMTSTRTRSTGGAWQGASAHGSSGAFFRLAAALLLLIVACSGGGASNNERNSSSTDAEVLVELVFIVRVTGNGEDVRLEVPLPLESDEVRVFDEEFRLRGFSVEEVVEEGVRLAVLTHPKLEGRRRFTYKGLVGVDSVNREVVSPEPGAPVDPALRRYTLPTPRLQSRSPLVRERLIEHLEPRLEAGDRDIVRMIFGMVGGQFERRTAGGTANVLRALREGHANDLGLDRLLVTFMRAAGIPARNVGGFRLSGKSGRKFDRWTEIHVGDEWVPVSVPKGWYGMQPPRYLRLYHGERRLIEREGVRRVTFKVLVREPGSDEGAPRPDPDEGEDVR